MTRARTRSRQQSTILVGCALALAVFGLGGVHTEVVQAVALLSLVALFVSLNGIERLLLEPTAFVLLGVVALTALQLAPLPFDWVEALAPRTAATFADAARARGDAIPTHTTISLDPQSTSLALIWWLAITATYLTIRRVVRRKNDPRQFAAIVASVGLGAFVGGLTITIAAPDLVEYSLRTTRALYASTVVNPNHLAALLNLACISALILAQTTDDGRWRVRWRAVFVVLLAAVTLTASRFGIATGVIGVLAVVTVYRAGQGMALGMLTISVVGAVILAVGAIQTEVGSLSDAPYDLDNRLEMAHLGVDVAQQWPWLGIGRGAFPSAHTQLMDHVLPAGETLTAVTITSAHNTPIQFLADYGLVGGGAILATGTIVLLLAFRRSAVKPIGPGLAVALVAVAVHNLVDFSLDILSVALAATLLLGALPVKGPGPKVSTLAVRACVVIAGLGVLASIKYVGPEAGPRRDRWIRANPDDALLKYPADSFAYLWAGMEHKDTALVDYSLRINPTDADTALAAASLRTGPEFFEHLRSALTLPSPRGERETGFSMLVQRAETTADILSGLPDDPAMTSAFLGWVQGPTAGLVAALVRRHPTDPDTLQSAASHYHRLGMQKSVEDLAFRMIAVGRPKGYEILGRIFERKGMKLEAYHMMMASDDARSLLAAARIALDAGWPERAREALRRVKPRRDQMKEWRDLKRRADGET